MAQKRDLLIFGLRMLNKEDVKRSEDVPETPKAMPGDGNTQIVHHSKCCCCIAQTITDHIIGYSQKYTLACELLKSPM